MVWRPAPGRGLLMRVTPMSIQQYTAVITADLDALRAQWHQAAALARDASTSRDLRVHLEAAQLQRLQLERIEQTLGVGR
jgi:hypothetical protein